MAKDTKDGGKSKADLSHLGRGHLSRFEAQPIRGGSGEAEKSPGAGAQPKQISRLYVDEAPGRSVLHPPLVKGRSEIEVLARAAAKRAGVEVHPRVKAIKAKAVLAKAEMKAASLASPKPRKKTRGLPPEEGGGGDKRPPAPPVVTGGDAEPRKGRGRPAAGEPWIGLGISRRTWFAREAARKKAAGEL